ncbi:hypothetical protein [Flagellimonas meridianipacifica]|uniref:Uncharacterized protein n=1 Tax=Flagellimonas meridianipacifica TaxID=1080225 RepID=A0A2T0MDD3_9FLAO|nr:hypothetical protein [Allomuricauda pacifica]PRX55495.1 hypothetical protein CLV81_3908 [Allomuricauda pacifica]
MKRLIPTVVVLCLAITMHGQIERDKALHFVGGGLFGLVGAGVAKKASDGNRVWTFVGAVAGSTLIGLAKESVDASQEDNGWDNDDLLATILGGVAVGVTIELFSKKDKDGRLRYSGRSVAIQPQLEPFDVVFLNKENTEESLPNLTPFGFSSNILNDYSGLTKSIP